MLSFKNWGFAKLLKFFFHQFLWWEEIWESWENSFLRKSEPYVLTFCRRLFLKEKKTVKHQNVCFLVYSFRAIKNLVLYVILKMNELLKEIGTLWGLYWIENNKDKIKLIKELNNVVPHNSYELSIRFI